MFFFYLNVSFCESYHLRKNFCHVQILHLKPFSCRLIEAIDSKFIVIIGQQ